VAKALGDKAGTRRYGHAYVPLDEALSRVVIDLSGRPGLHMDVAFKAGMIGGFDTQLAYEFFQGFANHALATLHIDNLKGNNAHHQCETIFKAFARALRMAVEPDPRSVGVASTKGRRDDDEDGRRRLRWATCGRHRRRFRLWLPAAT
jgi:imidazoleglycerol-phosphate dehydratase